MNNEPENYKLHEYDALRQESLEYIKGQNALFTFAFTVSISILAFALSKDMMVLGQGSMALRLVAFIALIPARCRHIFYHEMQFRIQSYMRVFLESEIGSLRWATIASRGAIEIMKTPRLFNGIEVHYYAYSIIGVAVCLSLLLNEISIQNIWVYVLAILAELFLIYLDLTMLKNTAKLRTEWDEYHKILKGTM